MREILFRGKAIDDNWYYGVPLVFTEDYVCMTAPHTYNKAVIPETIGQYTGLTDKNGKKIFEGDIVKADGYIFVVKFGKCGGVANDDNFGYMGFYFAGIDEITKKAISWGLRNDICYFVKREVIGNIHDNPELLKGGVQE